MDVDCPRARRGGGVTLCGGIGECNYRPLIGMDASVAETGPEPLDCSGCVPLTLKEGNL
jgi:hypothetical protein